MFCLALAGIATVTTAGEDKDVFAGWSGPGPAPLEYFVKPLDLTAAQQQQLKPIFAEAQARAAQDVAQDKARATQDRSASGEEILDQMVIRDADFRTRLATVLTAEQMSRYQELTAARAPRARTLVPHPAHGHGAMQGDGMVEHEGTGHEGHGHEGKNKPDPRTGP